MNSFLQYFSSNLLEIWDKTIEHLWLTGISVLLAIIIGLSCGILLTRYKKLSGPVIGFANVIQTIPSIALLGFMIPLAGIGAFPAIIALFLYALLPIIRNTFTGIDEVDHATREAGLGLGMSNFQLLTKIELPLAMPTIFAGIRTAAVINIGVATLCALIAAGGLGEFIFTGIALNNVNMILTGAVPAALLAIIIDLLLGLIQKSLKKSVMPVLVGFGIIAIAITYNTFKGSFGTHLFKVGMPAEFMERQDGWKALKDAYDINVTGMQMDPGLMYSALKNKKVDLIAGYSTDGRIEAYNLKVLKDDKNFFPPYYVAPLIRKETLEKYPELKKVLDRLNSEISNKEMQRMNYKVDHEKMDPEIVAKEFLQSKGFKTDIDRTGNADIIVGGKKFTEQYILAHIFEILIENTTPLTVDSKTGLGGTKICFEAIRNGDIDLYAEYTGTGFLVLLDPKKSKIRKIIKDKEAVYNYVKENFEKRYQLVWLKPLGFNNSYAMMMRKKQAEKLRIESISDLSEYLKHN